MKSRWTYRLGAETAPPRRYPEPASSKRTRKSLSVYDNAVMDALIRRYRRQGDEGPIPVTGRQIADECSMSKRTADRALQKLADCGFLRVLHKSTFAAKHVPSAYVLTAFPFEGEPPTFDYVADPDEWRRPFYRRESGFSGPRQWRVCCLCG